MTGIMRFPSNSRYLIPTRLFFIIGALIIGSDAAPFTSRTELQTAVTNCLAVDATGVTCCATADCGPAGSAEMKDWDVSSVTNMNQMFFEASAFNADLSSWDVSSVTDMSNMFWGASLFNADLSSWDVSSATDMNSMFWVASYAASVFNADISSWNVSSVTDMHSMFEGASLFNADISSWDVSSVTDMTRMFWGASLFNADLSSWDVSSVTQMYDMFHGAAMILVPGWYLEQCPAGHDGGNGQSCTSCGAGESTDGRTNVATCIRCVAGESTEGATGAATCTACAAGESTLGANGAATCTACAAGESTLNATGSAACTACAAGESTLGATGAISCTTCPEGEWQGRAGQAECIACYRVDWCLGGTTCAEGHQGEACFECAKDWYMLEDVCYPCKQDAKFFLLVFLGISVFAVFIAAVVFPGKVKAGWKRLQRVKKQAETRVDKIQKKTLGERSSRFGAVVFLVSLITFLQIQTLVVSVSVSWPSAVTAFFEALGDIVNLDAWGFINPKCSFDPGFTMNWMVRLFSPFLILLVVGGGIVFSFRKSGDDHTIDGVVRLVVQVLQLTFVGNVVHAMHPLDCAEYTCTAADIYCPSSGKYRVMESNPSIVCTTANPDYTPFLVCSVIGFIGYAVAYVVFIAYLLWRVNILAREHKDYVPSDAETASAGSLSRHDDLEKAGLEPMDSNTGPATRVVANEANDPSEEKENDQFERMIRGTHPDIQRLIRRYGLLFLPYSQRTWSWEIVAMARKSLMALTAVFFTTTPILQLELMLAQNVSWLVLLLWFRPFAAVPLMGGPFESKLHGDDRIARADQRWSSGNIVEIGMACCTVTLNVIGLTIGDGDLTAQLVFFFGQLIVVGALITRAVQSMGNQSVPFFGSVGDHMWKAMEEFGLSVEAAAERLRDFVLRRSGSDGEEEETR